VDGRQQREHPHTLTSSHPDPLMLALPLLPTLASILCSASAHTQTVPHLCNASWPSASRCRRSSASALTANSLAWAADTCSSSSTSGSNDGSSSSSDGSSSHTGATDLRTAAERHSRDFTREQQQGRASQPISPPPLHEPVGLCLWLSFLAPSSPLPARPPPPCTPTHCP